MSEFNLHKAEKQSFRIGKSVRNELSKLNRRLSLQNCLRKKSEITKPLHPETIKNCIK